MYLIPERFRRKPLFRSCVLAAKIATLRKNASGAQELKCALARHNRRIELPFRAAAG